MKEKHTEGKWYMKEGVYGTHYDIHPDNGCKTSPIAVCHYYGGYQTPEEAKANAAFIVTAVNSHEELLEACKNLLAREAEMTTGDLYQEFRAIETAIAAAEED